MNHNRKEMRNKNMRIWKRSMFSVVRKPLKTLLLFSVVFVISSLLLAGMAGKNSSIQVQDKAKASAGSSVRLEINLEDYRKRSGEVPGIPLPGNLWMSTAPNNSFSSVLTEDIKACLLYTSRPEGDGRMRDLFIR